MKKSLLTVLALAGAIFCGAEVIDINGSFKPDAQGQPEKWTFRDEKSGGTMEYTPGTPNRIKLNSVPKKYVSLVSKSKISAKIGDKFKYSLKMSPKKSICIGFYLNTPKGGYITSLQKSSFSQADGTVTLEFTIIDPTKRGFEVGSIYPFIKVYNGGTIEVTEAVLEKLPAGE